MGRPNRWWKEEGHKDEHGNEKKDAPKASPVITEGSTSTTWKLVFKILLAGAIAGIGYLVYTYGLN